MTDLSMDASNNELVYVDNDANPSTCPAVRR